MNVSTNKFKIKHQTNKKIIQNKNVYQWLQERARSSMNCRRHENRIIMQKNGRQGQKFTSTSRRVKSALVRPAFFSKNLKTDPRVDSENWSFCCRSGTHWWILLNYTWGWNGHSSRENATELNCQWNNQHYKEKYDYTQLQKWNLSRLPRGTEEILMIRSQTIWKLQEQFRGTVLLGCMT